MNNYKLKLYSDYIVIEYMDKIVRKYKLKEVKGKQYVSTNILDLLYNVLIEKRVTINFINMKGKWKK